MQMFTAQAEISERRLRCFHIKNQQNDKKKSYKKKNFEDGLYLILNEEFITRKCYELILLKSLN